MYFKNAKRIVIKLGSSTIVDKNNNFKSQWLKSLIADIKKLRKENKDIVIVSSGAIALGKKNLKIKTTKLQVEMSQALAAIGQIHLVKEFQKTFLKERINVGQILITQEDTEIRRRSLNARRAFENLFKFVATEVREILASLGIKSINEIIGRSDLLLQVNKGASNLDDLDLNPLLVQADPGENLRYCKDNHINKVPETLDEKIFDKK